jgi:predicted RNase H-like nuclease (RuvC/YqgF family)
MMADLNNFVNEFIERLARIEVKIDNIEKIKDDVEELKRENVSVKSQVESQDKEIKALKDTNKWLIRLLITELAGIITTIAIAIINSGIKL